MLRNPYQQIDIIFTPWTGSLVLSSYRSSIYLSPNRRQLYSRHLLVPLHTDIFICHSHSLPAEDSLAEISAHLVLKSFSKYSYRNSHAPASLFGSRDPLKEMGLSFICLGWNMIFPSPLGFVCIKPY